MSGERWTDAARFFTASIVGFLLTAGLCGYGGFGSPGEHRLSDLQVKADSAGALLFLVSFLDLRCRLL